MITLFRHPRRVGQVIAIVWRYLVAPGLPFRSPDPRPRPVRVRLVLEELGGAWIKLGQMLAMRFDLLPAAYCDALFELLNRVRPFPYAQVSAIITDQLGAPPEEIFARFEPNSFAAASIGQVHRAVLPTGELVAVKVQRPGIRQDLAADIDLMYAFARVVDWTRLFGATRTRVVIDEFARWTADELDYLVEARQAVLLREHAGGDGLEKIAQVYREYTTSTVLTTELIEGVPVIEVMTAVREGNTSYLESLRAHGYDLDRVVRNLDWNMLNQVYVYGYFHADLHPANLFILPGNAIGYVDYGIVGQLPERVRESLTYYGWLLFRGDVEAAVAELMRWLAPTPASDATTARRRLIRVHQTFLYDTAGSAASSGFGPRRGGRRLSDNPYSRLAVDIMRIVRENELAISHSLVAYLKMLVTLGTIRHQLAVEYDLSVTVRRFFTRLLRGQGATWLDPRRALDRAYTGAVQLRRAVEFVEFLEAQEPVITEAVNSLFGLRRRIRRARRRLVTLGGSVLIVGAALYFVLSDPDGTRRMLPAGVTYPVVHGALVVILLVLVGTLVLHMRQFGQEE